MVSVDKPAPDFEADAYWEGKIKRIRLSDLMWIETSPAITKAAKAAGGVKFPMVADPPGEIISISRPSL